MLTLVDEIMGVRWVDGLVEDGGSTSASLLAYTSPESWVVVVDGR